MLVEQAGRRIDSRAFRLAGFRRNTAQSRDVPPPVLVLLGSISLQVGAAFAKGDVQHRRPSRRGDPAAGVRGLILLVVWRPSVRSGRRAWVTVVCYGIVLAGMNMCIYRAFEHIPLGVAVTIEFLGPLAVALFGSRRKLGVAVGAARRGRGVPCCPEPRAANWTGVAFALTAALLWAGYILLGARLGSQTSGGSGLALAMAVGTAVAAPFGVVEAGPALLDRKCSRPGWWWP